MPESLLNIADDIDWICQLINMSVSLSHNHKIEKRKSTVFFRQYRGHRFSKLHIKMSCHSETGQSKSLFLLTVALLCFQAKKLPFSHGNCDSDWLTDWLFLYNYRIIYRLANTKDLYFSTYSLSDGFWQSFISIEVCRDRKPALASSCKKRLTGFFVCLLFFLKVKHIS